MNKTILAAMTATLIGGSSAIACIDPCFPDSGTDTGTAREVTEICEEHGYVHVDSLEAFSLGAASAFASAVRGQTLRIARSFYRGRSAGDLFDNPSLELTYAHSEFEDDALAIDGNTDALTLALSGNHGDNIAGIGITAENLSADGGIDVDTITIDGYYGFSVSDNLTAGVLGTISFIDAGAGGDDTQVGLGPFLSGYMPLGDTLTLGGTAAVLYVDSVNDELWLLDVLVDLGAQLADNVGASAYVGYTDAFEDDVSFENYFTVGIDVDWAVNDSWSVRAGYEKTLGHSDIDDNTIILSAAYSF